MSDTGIVKVEETGRGVESITSIDKQHPLIKNFSPSILNTDDTAVSAAKTTAEKFVRPGHKKKPSC